MTTQKKEHEIKYNETTISVLNKLAKIQSKLLFQKKEDEDGNSRLVVNAKTADSTIMFLFNTPIENFNFKGDNIAFYDFNEFYDLFDIFKDNKKLLQETDNIKIKSKGLLTYYLADEESIKSKINGVKFENPDVCFELTIDQLKELNKLIGKLGTKSVKFAYNEEDKQLDVKLFSGENSKEKDNTYQYSIEPSQIGDDTEEFSITIDKEIFSVLPENDYIVSIKSEGVIEFEHISGDIEYKIYTSELDEE